MSRTIEFPRKVRGTLVIVIASEFVWLESGPDELLAETASGQPFKLTARETAKLKSEATKLYLTGGV